MLLGSFFLFPSCIVPPPGSPSSSPLSRFARARAYLDSGYLDEAELELRHILQLSDSSSEAGLSSAALAKVYGDLAFTLLARSRLSEARDFFTRAIELCKGPSALLISLRCGLAELGYALGNLDFALREYGRAVDLIESGAVPQESFGSADRAGVFRRISVLNYVLGDADTALCYSKRALSLLWTFPQLKTHVRLLMALDRDRVALEFLKSIVSLYKDKTPAGILLDYSLCLYESGDRPLARGAAMRVLSAATSDYYDRITARILLLLLESGDRETLSERGEFLFSALREDLPTLCDGEDFDKYEYWPFAFHADAKSLLCRLCRGAG